MGNHKMWNILKTGLAVLRTPYVGMFLVRSFEITLGSFGSLYKVSDVKIFKRLLLPQFSSTFN